MRKKNLKIQMHNIINDMLAIGSSKKMAKKEYRAYCKMHEKVANPSKSFYIHSYNTADAYRQTINQFSDYLREFKKDVWSSKDLGSIDKNVLYDYLRYREENGKSPYTISKDMACFNKVFNLDLNKRDGNLSKRSYKKVFRSRVSREMDSHVKLSNWKEQICFSYSFGLRRSSICGGQYTVKADSLLEKNGRIYCCVIEKGGKYREAPCLKIMENYIRNHYSNIKSVVVDNPFNAYYSKEQFKELYKNSNNKPFFKSYSQRIDNHSFRGKYARRLYKEILKKCGSSKEKVGGYDKKTVIKVSKALGHNRASVVIEHYLR